MSLTPVDALAIFLAMGFLAAIPSLSVLAVTARAASAGFRQGAWVALGIVAGDTVFIVLAIFGLQWLAAALGDAFVWLKTLGGVYLLWLGFRLWRADPAVEAQADGSAAASTSSFVSGLLLTLGDQKAILFYLGFFPAFVDLAALTPADALAIVVIAAVAVGGVKLAYAAVASRAGAVTGPRLGRILNRVAGGVLLATGVYLMARA
ncbi:MAG: LysE family translocator [Burkholderiales bacterium]|nr:LysE family translocator [Burkholderiales bacterium]